MENSKKQPEYTIMKDGKLKVRHANIFFTNFTGKYKPPYNDEGKRNFCLELSPDIADILAERGWNVKSTNPRQDEEVGTPYVQVEVRFDNFPPTIESYTYGSTNKIIVDEDICYTLDTVEFYNINVTINPSDYGSKKGLTPGKGKAPTIKAYLHSAVLTIMPSAFSEDEIMEDIGCR